MGIIKDSFWDQKIALWEARRYFQKDLSIEMPLAEFKGNPLQFRMYITARLLSPQIKNLSVLDLGCGSGRLLSYLEPAKPKKLYGIDFSKNAIRLAREKNPASHFEFMVGDVVKTPFPPTDYVVGLGLLDWLTEAEIRMLFDKMKGQKFIFSFSERREVLRRNLHSIFVMLTYGWKTNGYIPIYHTQNQIEGLIDSDKHQKLYFFRHPKLSFSTLVSNFPLEIT